MYERLLTKNKSRVRVNNDKVLDMAEISHYLQVILLDVQNHLWWILYLTKDSQLIFV